MPKDSTVDPRPGFHEGELAVQARAGVREDAERLAGMLDPADLTGGAATFLAQRTFAVLTARDVDGVLWTSPLVGPAGFFDVRGPQDLHIAAAPAPDDPLVELPAPQDVGLLAIDFARRRRVRVNGRLTGVDDDGLLLDAQQAYGNCPQYIHPRTLAAVVGSGPSAPRPTSSAGSRRLSDDDSELIRGADTFFLGTTHPTRGADASHRGGPAGFVRVVDDTTLWWPDYPGNNMFNSLGNLEVDPTAALLFVDWSTGSTVHLTGRAVLEQVEPGSPEDDGHTGRRIRFDVDRAVSAGAR